MMRAPARSICGVRVDAVTYDDAIAQVIDWARAGESRVVCFSNAHLIMEANDSAAYGESLRSADIVAPDGVPVVWTLRLLGVTGASRVYGPDFANLAIVAAERQHIPVALYGGAPSTLHRLTAVLCRRFPSLNIACAFAPPFRPLSHDEDERYTGAIRDSGARIVLVGLGCPKQEQWMAAHRGLLPAVMLGVGAAFDFLPGAKPQAPRWMMSAGLEWLFRLVTEPRRLGARYLKHNPRFLFRVLRQLRSSQPFV